MHTGPLIIITDALIVSNCQTFQTSYTADKYYVDCPQTRSQSKSKRGGERKRDIDEDEKRTAVKRKSNRSELLCETNKQSRVKSY